MRIPTNEGLSFGRYCLEFRPRLVHIRSGVGASAGRPQRQHGMASSPCTILMSDATLPPDDSVPGRTSSHVFLTCRSAARGVAAKKQGSSPFKGSTQCVAVSTVHPTNEILRQRCSFLAPVLFQRCCFYVCFGFCAAHMQPFGDGATQAKTPNPAFLRKLFAFGTAERRSVGVWG